MVTKVKGSVISSDGIGYTPAGTGAVVTDVQTKLRQFETDADYTTLQQLINRGGFVRITSNQTISSQIELPSNIHIFVEKGVTLTYSGSMASASMFYATGKSNIVIEYATAVGDSTIASSDTHKGSFGHFDTCTNVQIRHNNISSFPQTSVAFVDCTDCVFENNTVDTISSPTDVSSVCGLNVEDACVGTVIRNNKFVDIGNATNDYQGLGIRVIKQTTTMPTKTTITGNIVKNCTEHGIVIYDGTTNAANNDPETIINNNVILDTGLAATDAGVGTNTRGNGIYCLGFVPGSIVGNVVKNANTNSTTTSIADAGIAVMLGTGATQPQTSLIIDSSVNGANAGFEIQNVAGFSLKGSFTGIANKGIEIGQCSDFKVDAIVSSTTSTDIGCNVSAPSTGCRNFNIDLTTNGFGTGLAVSSAAHGTIKLNADQFSTRGYIVTASDSVHCSATLEPASDIELVTTSGASTDCHINLKASDRATSNVPFVRNNGTGVIIETYASSLPPAGGTWAVGDKVTLRVPASGAPDYARCTVANTPGTWNTGGNLS